jgi:hypothetical protein
MVNSDLFLILKKIFFIILFNIFFQLITCVFDSFSLSDFRIGSRIVLFDSSFKLLLFSHHSSSEFKLHFLSKVNLIYNTIITHWTINFLVFYYFFDKISLQILEKVYLFEKGRIQKINLKRSQMNILEIIDNIVLT